MKNINEQTTAIYCRVARKDDDAIEHQELSLKRYASENGYRNIMVYSDNGFGGLNLDRPAFKRLQDDIASGKIRTVIVKDAMRISRKFLEAPLWIDAVQKQGVKVVSAMGIQLDCGFAAIMQTIHREMLAYDSCRKKKAKTRAKK